MEAQLRQFYPNAISYNAFIERTYTVMSEKYGLRPEQILLAHSICSDDVNAIQFPAAGRQMLGPFNLGGLNGYPFTGLTGMSAFAHHVPEGGAALVFYAPHIGLTAQGQLGSILRVGQQAPSACCGAAALALSRVSNGTVPADSPPSDDYQQSSLESILYAQRERVLAAEHPIHEATEVIFDATSRQIDHLVQHTSFLGKYLFVVGAVIINGDWQYGSFVEPRRFERLDTQTGQLLETVDF